MKYASILFFVLLAMVISGCSNRKILTDIEFKSMSPVNGKIVKFEKIPWGNDFRPRSGAGPHYRIVLFVPNGDYEIEVSRFMTDMTWWRVNSEDGILGLSGEMPSAFYEKIKSNNVKLAQIQQGMSKAEVMRKIGKPDTQCNMAYTYPDTRGLTPTQVREIQRSLPDEIWSYKDGIKISFSKDEVVKVRYQEHINDIPQDDASGSPAPVR